LDPYWIEEAQMAGTRLVNIELPAGEMLLSVGRMTLGERYKGHEQIISALPRVIEAVPDAFYVAVGEGDLVDSLRELAQKVGVDGRVIFPGRVSSDELKSYYDRASLFVLPSKGEGFGFVYLEAMYHRNAVIAGNRDAAAEVVRHGETGLLVDPDDINGLANTIVGLLKDDRRREAMGQRGHELVLQEYTFERFQHRLLSYLEELISDKR
jgi:glycosyltransferase involved in cell wall biosynthesis